MNKDDDFIEALDIVNDINVKYGRVEDLFVWKKAILLAKEIYPLIKNLKEYALKDQIFRSSISIASNIAEGYERQTNKELIRYLYIAKGSCGELRTQLIIYDHGQTAKVMKPAVVLSYYVHIVSYV